MESKDDEQFMALTLTWMNFIHTVGVKEANHKGTKCASFYIKITNTKAKLNSGVKIIKKNKGMMATKFA